MGAAPLEADPAESLAYLPIPAEATVLDLIRLANTCPNPRQRADLLRRVVAMAPKDVQVLRLLRGHASSASALVRAAAEDGLATIFGPAWNQSRTITAPIQPPRSDD